MKKNITLLAFICSVSLGAAQSSRAVPEPAGSGKTVSSGAHISRDVSLIKTNDNTNINRKNNIKNNGLIHGGNTATNRVPHRPFTNNIPNGAFTNNMPGRGLTNNMPKGGFSNGFTNNRPNHHGVNPNPPDPVAPPMNPINPTPKNPPQ